MRLNPLRNLRAALARVGAAIASEVERDELLLIAGLVCVTAALWPAFRWGALLGPGAVLVWIALPSRRPFVDQQPPAPLEDPKARRARSSAADAARRS